MNKALSDFLLYSYFGIIKEQENQLLLTHIVDCAYLDASKRVLTETPQELDTGKNLIINCIYNYPCGKKGFDEWHKCLCENLFSMLNPKKENNTRDAAGKRKSYFQIGNAQKWVNMSIKYIWLLKDEIPFFKELNVMKEEKHFHIPLDSYILQTLKECGKFINKNFENKEENFQWICGSGDSYSFRTEKGGTLTTWSNISKYSSYMKLQEKIRGEILENGNPLDWENETWIAIAKGRRLK